jgi:tRNA dimethylallyltransferase
LTQSSFLQPPSPVLFLLGPTASGKTALAIWLHDFLQERCGKQSTLISVDSACVYRDMNIGTAKPDMAMQALHPHQLIDLIAPTNVYDAAQFCRDANAAIAAAHAQNILPIFVGGTMLYIKALVEGLSQLPVADKAVRARLDAQAAVIGWSAMHDELAKVDPVRAAQLSPNDSQRVQRALEIFALTGMPMSSQQLRISADKPTQRLSYRSLFLGLQPSDRAVLHARIALRFDAMLEQGLVAEVQALQQKYTLHADMPAMRAVGYRQVWDFLDATSPFYNDAKQLRERGIAATRQLAKRQLTWLRAMSYVEPVDCLRADLHEYVGSTVTKFLHEG